MLDKLLNKIPLAGPVLSRIYRRIRGIPVFSGSAEYWEQRYRDGGNSGAGSYYKFAEYKGKILNQLVSEKGIRTVIEFGCGDGNQLAYFEFQQYRGYDVSETAIRLCREKYGSDPSKTFSTMESYAGETAELALSLDVLYHLVEDEVYHSYMQTLFSAGERYVAIYSSNDEQEDSKSAEHVRLRRFSDWVDKNAAGFVLERHIPNPWPFDGDSTQSSISDFFIYRNLNQSGG